MKKIIILIFVVQLVSLILASGGQKPLQNFKVYIVDTRTDKKKPEDAIKIDGKPLLLEYKNGEMTFYKVKEKEVNGKKYTFPELDDNGKGIPLIPSEKDFLQDLKLTIVNNITGILDSNYNNEHVLGFKTNTNDNDKGYFYLRYFNKNAGIRISNYLNDSSNKFYDGSFFILNTKLIYELNKFENGVYTLEYRCALNPDIQKYPGFDIYNHPISYLGCIWMQLGNKNAVVNGKPNPMPAALELTNKNSAVPLQWLVNNYSSSKSYSFDAKKNVATVKRFISPSAGWKTIEFTVGKSTANVDGREKPLPFKVYMKNGAVMVPLKFTNETLNGFSLLWRDYDNTVLIYR